MPRGCRADAKHPYYGERGLNAGVLLANLARMRNSTFSAERDDIIATWGAQGALPWGDQDVLNVYLNRHNDQAYVLSCKFNVRCGMLLRVGGMHVKPPYERGAEYTEIHSLRLPALEVFSDVQLASPTYSPCVCLDQPRCGNAFILWSPNGDF